MWQILAVAALVAGPALAAPAPAAPFDPRPWQQRHVGQPTQVLVIGTPHLSGTPEGWNPEALAPLLDRLAAFRPDEITIEALAGRSIQSMWTYRASFPDVATSYGSRALVLAGLAQPTLGLDMPQAEAEVRATLRAWPADPAPAQRRRLAALFAAAGDPSSALVQWWRLPPAERVADASVSPLLARELEAQAGRRNENHLIGARLAVRLGLERVNPVDDQSDEQDPALDKAMEAFFGEPWAAALRADPAFRPLAEAAAHLGTPDAALATYRMLNSVEATRTDADGQWLSMLTRPSPEQAGRRRVALWEVRNLRMVANIREVAARHPGGRVLVIVGSAHKPWFDAYLRMMSDVAVVDAAAVLGQ